MNTNSLPDVSNWAGACTVSTLACIKAQGADAATFLHGQLSQDVQSLGPQEARLGAYCSAKGRMLASMLLLAPQPEQVWLLLCDDVLPATLKRLQMFVLRAKAKLSDERGTTAIVGLVGTASLAAIPGADSAALSRPYQVQVLPAASADDASTTVLVRLPDVQGLARWLWIGPQAAAQGLMAALPALDADRWAWLDVMSGVPQIEAATVDQFVPQMVNFEIVGGVNFKKGCYPGQEVVARSQYRGTTKRRVFLAHADAAITPGQEVFAADDPGQPAGLVVNAATRPMSDGEASALIELKLAHAGSALSVGALEGPALTLAPLPYELPGGDD
ncbi:MAG TPA: folate-binding protein [Aquabacterium sp.]|uniref:CAF17-like 4Fe-4S cluster assembly/insertion protein YgfZ n=1 Tax=Aquabacterium sp. TaxID=1872578 RepID=UPI002E3300DA|nr:folate-binding protein [Aquabacterium sp.]HEX5373541.1 folate-binding protein [Aquabacterium sp.]